MEGGGRQPQQDGFHLSVGELFWLVSIPGLVGATLWFPYGFTVPYLGRRTWKTISAALLLIPTILLVPAVIGLRLLGLGARAAGTHLSLASVGFIWIPFVIAAAVCAGSSWTTSPPPGPRVSAQAQILRRKHTWVMSCLYIGTFGSFIGYSAAFPLLIKTQFHGVNPLEFAFLGPLVGSLRGADLGERPSAALLIPPLPSYASWPNVPIATSRCCAARWRCS